MRPRHPKKEGEQALREIEAAGLGSHPKKAPFSTREGSLLPKGLPEMKVRVGVAFDVLADGGTPDQDQLAAHLGDLLDALMGMGGVVDPDVSATLSEGHVEISLTLEAEDELSAAEEGTTAVRAAVNAAGGYQSWGVVDDNMHVSINRLDELSPA